MPEFYIQFNLVGRSKSGKTKIFEVASTRNGELLGTIEWYAPWRRYVFMPDPGSALLFDAVCLDTIASFLREETQDHKNGLS